MGLIYTEGRGVERDEAGSFYWLTRAIKQGDRDAEQLCNVVAAGMTAGQFDQAAIFLQADQLVQSQSRRKGDRRCKRTHKQIHLR